jgi:cytidine deaminase
MQRNIKQVIQKMQTTTYKDLNKKERELVDRAEKSLKYSYDPYHTKTVVSAAVRTEKGKIITGGSFANHSSTSNICAERSVISVAISQGERNIAEMAIIGFCPESPKEKPFTPCGICRQSILELTRITGKDVIIYCCSQDKTKIIKTSIYELLPNPY